MQDFQEVKALKDRAFPKNEQIPMKLLLLWARRSCARFTAYYDGSAFCGMTYTCLLYTSGMPEIIRYLFS